MRRWTTWALLGVTLTGCMTTDPGAWKATNPDGLKRDIYECKQEADAVMRQMASFGGAIVPLVALFKGPKMYRECMEARGWNQTEQP